MTRSRFGIAILFPAEIASEIDGIRLAIGSAQLTRIEPHLTLFPPCNLSDSELDGLILRLRNLGSRFAGFQLELNGCGTFDRDPGVLFLAVTPSKALLELEEGVRLANGAPERQRDFIPHVTLYDNAPQDLVKSGVDLLGRYYRVVEVEGFWILRQDPKGTWQRYTEVLFEDSRRRSGAGAPVTFYRSGAIGPWLQGVGDSLGSMWSAYPCSDLESGISPGATLSVSGYREDGTLCALGVVALFGARAWLKWMWVSPPERGLGLGATLLDELIHYCNQTGVRELFASRRANSDEEFAKVAHLAASMGAKVLQARDARELVLDAGNLTQFDKFVMRFDLANRT